MFVVFVGQWFRMIRWWIGAKPRASHWCRQDAIAGDLGLGAGPTTNGWKARCETLKWQAKQSNREGRHNQSSWRSKEVQRLLLFLMLGIEIKRRKMKVHSYLPEFVSPRISKGCISCVWWSKHWQNMTLSMPRLCPDDLGHDAGRARWEAVQGAWSVDTLIACVVNQDLNDSCRPQ